MMCVWVLKTPHVCSVDVLQVKKELGELSPCICPRNGIFMISENSCCCIVTVTLKLVVRITNMFDVHN